MNEKIRIRKQINQIRNNISDVERNNGNKRIHEKLFSHPKWKKAEYIISYASYGSEVDTWAIFSQALYEGKKIALPKIVDLKNGRMTFVFVSSKEELIVGYHGILEPSMQSGIILDERWMQYHCDNNVLVLLPGLAFDSNKNRLGYGGGFYDRFLYWLRENGKRYAISDWRMALLFQCQMVDKVPNESYDECMDELLTD